MEPRADTQELYHTAFCIINAFSTFPFHKTVFCEPPSRSHAATTVMASNPTPPNHSSSNVYNYNMEIDDLKPCADTAANGLNKLSMRRAKYGDMAWAHTTITPMTLRQISEGIHPLWVPYGPGESGPAPFKQRIGTYEGSQMPVKGRYPQFPAPTRSREGQVPDPGRRLKSLLEGSVPDLGQRIVRQEAIGHRLQHHDPHVRPYHGLGANIGQIRQNAEISEPFRLPLQRQPSTPYDQPGNARDTACSFSSTASTLVGSSHGVERRNTRRESERDRQARGVDAALPDTEDEAEDK